MIYKTVVIDKTSKVKKMSAAIETKTNKMAQEGWELVTLSMTDSFKAILVFRKEEEIRQEKIVSDEDASESDLPYETGEMTRETE